MANVQKIQAGYAVRPLSAYLKQAAAVAAPAVDFPKIDKELVKTNFFAYLAFALQFAPPGPEETGIRARLARIGVGPGAAVNFDAFSPEARAALAQGMKEGARKVDEAASQIGVDVNGWKIGSAFGDRAFYGGNWLKRAAAAKAGIYGNDAAEAVYPMTKAGRDGQPLDGSQHAYTLTFASGQLPPARAFWSLTMYDGKTLLLIRNPIGRYLINSSMLSSLAKGPDGSVTVYIQKDSPGKAKESNWLPAPDGPLYLVMRLYWPRTEPPSILPPGTWQPPAVVRAAGTPNMTRPGRG
jgi:hypothetical protein